MNKTISKNLLLRLAAQADEAEIYGNVKIASILTDTIKRFADNNAVRADEAKYEYKSNDLYADVRLLVWSAAMRVFDYYDSLPDARIIDDAVEDLTDTLVESFENLVEGVDKGKFEPKTPGENDADEGDVPWEVSESSENETVVEIHDDDTEESN
jgi:hypothetical protein